VRVTVTERVRLAADDATLPLMRALVDAYMELNPHVILTLKSGNAGSTADLLTTRQVSLAAVSLLPETSNKLWAADLAMDGVAIIVHARHPLDSLSLREARDIFGGVRNDWRDFGVDGLGSVEVAVREGGDGTRALFDRYVMGDQRLTLDALIMPSVETMMNYVALKPGAIGYVPSAWMGALSPQPAVKALMLDGQALSADNVAGGRYPLSRTLSLIALAEPQGALRKFVAWALGPQGKEIAASLGYVVVK
jgi:phosphate transport system substrate-binding protein